MIKVDKSTVKVPTSLSVANTQASLEAIWNEGNIDKNKIDSDIYGAGDVRTALSDLYHNKCAYCETFDDGFQIEHFRPKKLLAVKDRHNGHTHDGYYWLAYEWTNLMPGCYDCNRSGVKGNRFPTVKPNVKIPALNGSRVDISKNSYTDSYLADEQPIFLNPEEASFDPFKYFKFDKDGWMDSKPVKTSFDFTRADTTIEVFQLNRLKIYSQYRKWHLSKIMGRIKLLYLELVAKQISVKSFKKLYFLILEEMYNEISPKQQYTFFWNYLYTKIDWFIKEHIDDKAMNFLASYNLEFKQSKS